MSRPMSYEPGNGPEIVVPDSEPADGEWPNCKGIVECKFVGFKRKCRCRIPKPIAEVFYNVEK